MRKQVFKSKCPTIKEREFLELEILKLSDELEGLELDNTKQIKEIQNKINLYKRQLLELNNK